MNKEILLNFEITDAYNSVCYTMAYIIEFLKKNNGYKIILNEKNINTNELNKLLEHLDITAKNIKIEDITEAHYNFLLTQKKALPNNENMYNIQFEGNFLTPVIHNLKKLEKINLYSNTKIGFIHLYQRIKIFNLYHLAEKINKLEQVGEPLKLYNIPEPKERKINYLVIGKEYKINNINEYIKEKGNICIIRAKRTGGDIKIYEKNDGILLYITKLLKQKEINELMKNSINYIPNITYYDTYNQTYKYAVLNDCNIINTEYSSIYPFKKTNATKKDIIKEIEESKKRIKQIIEG